MNEKVYAAARAVTLVAVGQLQNLAYRTSKVYYQERYLRAADNLLNGMLETKSDPELLSLGSFSELELEHAIGKQTRGESTRIVVLRQAAIELRCRKLVNVKKTIRRRYELQKPLLKEEVVSVDNPLRIEDRLECADLIEMVPPRQRAILTLRLTGLNDNSIAEALGLSRQNVALIAHRAHVCIRDRVAVGSPN